MTFYNQSGLGLKEKSHVLFHTDTALTCFFWLQVWKHNSCQPKSNRSGFSNWGMCRCFCHACIFFTKPVGQSPARLCSATRFMILHLGNTSWPSVKEATCKIFANICTESTLKISIRCNVSCFRHRTCPYVITVDNVNGLCCVLYFFYLSNCIFLA